MNWIPKLIVLLVIALVGCNSSVPQERLDFIEDRAEQFVLASPNNWQAVESIELNTAGNGNLAPLKDPNAEELICYEVILHGVDYSGESVSVTMYSSAVRVDDWFVEVPSIEKSVSCRGWADKSVRGDKWNQKIGFQLRLAVLL